MQEKVQDINFLAEYLLHAIKLLTHVVPGLYTLSGVVHTANKETIQGVK